MRSGKDVGYGLFIGWDAPKQSEETCRVEWKVRRNRRNSCGETLRDAALGRGRVLYSVLRLTSGEPAAQHRMNAALLLQLGGVKARLLWLGEEELCSRHHPTCQAAQTPEKHQTPRYSPVFSFAF